nr:immunoglobulin light chain junction region [Macaca mulatta]
CQQHGNRPQLTV